MADGATSWIHYKILLSIYPMSLDTIWLYYVIDNGKDSEFEELLQLVNALEFLELFKNEKVGKKELMACDLNDLISFLTKIKGKSNFED